MNDPINVGKPTRLDQRRPAGRRRVLFLPSHPASLKEMLMVADAFVQQQRHECTFVIAWPCDEARLRAIQQQGYKLVLESKSITVRPAPNKPTRRRSADEASWFKRLRVRTGLDTFAGLCRHWRRHRRAIRQARSLIVRHRPDLIVTPSDRLVGLQTALIVQAQRQGVPTLVIPWSVSDPAGQVYLRKCEPDWQLRYGTGRWINRLVARWYPNYATQADDQTILFLPGEVALPARWLGIMPPTPWGLAGGGGLATKVAVEGQRVYRQALELGMPPERLVLTGRASTDQLFLARQQAAQSKDAWRTRHRLDQCCRLVLCAVPQFAEHGLLSWPEHWRELEFLFGELSAVPGSQLVLSLHPKCNPSDYRAVATKFGAVLAEEPIEKLMPLADLFVSTISSTIVAAIGCHVPAIILDMYGMNYDTYAGCGGTVTVKTREQFSAALARITGDQQFYQQLVQANRQTAGEWIQLDGRCCQRLVSVAGAMMAGAIADHGPTRKAA